MKILLLSQYFWPEVFRINDVVQSLKDRGHEVEVLTGLPNYPTGRIFDGYRLDWKPSKDSFDGVRIQRVPLLPRGNGGGKRLFLNYLSFALSAALYGPRLTARPDVILVFQISPVTVGIPAAVLRRMHGAPVAFWLQDLWPETLKATGAVTHPIALKMVSRLVRWIYARCDCLLIQSRAFVSSVVEHGVDLSRIEYLPNSAEPFYKPVEVPIGAPERALLPEGFKIMFAGNIGVSQDLETLLAAAERLRDTAVRWIILGDGRQRTWLEAEIERRGLQNSVFLLGSYPAERMPTFFALADALLVSLKDEAIFASTVPSKLQSYLACGRPILAALNGEGARVVLDASAGLAPGAENPEALSKAVLNLQAMTQEERDAMGQRGYLYFKKQFEREVVYTRLEDILLALKNAGLQKMVYQ